MVLKGKLIHCKREVKEFKDSKSGKTRKSEEKLFISLAEVEYDEAKFAELKEVFVESGEKFTPDWVKNFEGYVNVSTQFELPAILFGTDSEGARIETASIENAIENGYAWMGAEVGLSLDLKEGAVYPRALKFYSEGNAINAFADFDEEE